MALEEKFKFQLGVSLDGATRRNRKVYHCNFFCKGGRLVHLNLVRAKGPLCCGLTKDIMDEKCQLPFKEGQTAEARSFEVGFRGAWFRCKIQEISHRRGHWNALLYIQMKLSSMSFSFLVALEKASGIAHNLSEHLPPLGVLHRISRCMTCYQSKRIDACN